MPFRPSSICSCGLVIANGATCPCKRKRRIEARKAYDAQRPTASARGYDETWRKLRSDFLAAHPRCCRPTCTEAATEVDHIQTVRERPDLRLSWSNLRPMCRHHHSQRTARDQRGARGVVSDFTP